MSNATELTRLLMRLKAAADLPVERAMSMPPEMYHREDILDLESERIFRRGWTCPGFISDIPNPGDYLTYSIADQPVILVHGDDGKIRAFSNVCRHRMATLLEGRGNRRRIVCPYHGWSYDLRGRLVGAGHMDRSECFEKSDYSIPEIRVELWKGWVYVTLDPSIESIANILAPLSAIVDQYGMEHYVPILQQEQTWKANWKIAVENFTEGYHGPIAHRSTVGAGINVSDTRFPTEKYLHFTYSTFTKPENAQYGVAHPKNTHLTGAWRRTAVLANIFPAHMYSLSPDYLWYLSLRPKGAGELSVRVGVALAPEVHASTENLSHFVGSLTEFFDRVNAEDRAIVEGVFRGSFAPSARSGPLSWLERGVHDFIRYLAATLVESNA